MTLRPIALAVLVAIGLGAGFLGTSAALRGFGAGAEDREAAEGAEAEAALVTAERPREQTVLDTFEAVGTILPIQSIEIRPLTEGRVQDVRFEPGAPVEEGAVLFTLDDRAERAALQSAEATLVEAEAELRRNETLIDRDVASEAAVEAARAAFLRAEAEVLQAENAIADRVVRAPFAGVVGLADLDPGERVAPDIVVTTLDDLSSVEVEFSLPEQYFAAVEPGQTVRLSGAAYGERVFEGEVSATAPRIAEASRSFAVRATVPNPDRALVGGMFVTASLVLDERRALTVPEAAVISEGDGDFVFAFDGGTAARLPISIGLQVEGDVEIVEGIDAETLVVTSGYAAIEDGDPVRRQERDAERQG